MADPPIAARCAMLPHRLLLDEFIHRSANDLAVACVALGVARRAASLEDARGGLDTVLERLMSLASIQRLLLSPESATIDLGTALCDLCHHQALARFSEQGIFVRVRSADIVADSRRGWVVLMIVSELLTNAARHAFSGYGGLVDVTLGEVDGQIACIVRDDGVGLHRDGVLAGTGTAILAALARDAGIGWQSASGSTGTRIELRMMRVV
jgi:two-component sensor histidine kinase